jgi:beta-alanine--pyruvate transaminase
VITGFGRTGKPFAAQTFGVVPDLITVAKALTNGTVPMGAVAISDGIYEQITASAPEGGIEFFHGYTYSAHPLACAAGIATQTVFREEGVFERSAELAPYFLERLFDLRRIPVIRDIRGFGLLGAVELAPAGGFGQRGYAALQRIHAAGLVVRVTADTVILAPALIAEREHVDHICDTLGDVFSAL